MNSPEEASIKLVGQNAGVDIPSCKIYKSIDTNKELAVSPNLYEKEPFFGHFYLVDNLKNVLSGNAEPIVKPEVTINAAAILECFYKSAELGREVNLEELV